MAEIELVSTCSVKMSTDSLISRVELTPWDLQLLLLDPIQKGILFYKPQNQTQEFEETFINHLKTSLSRALDFFPPLSGRLATTTAVDEHDGASYFFINCNNAGAEFTHAKARGVYVRDILNPTYTPVIVRSFFSLNGVSNIEGLSKPLLGVQVTELVDGFFIACTANHSVMDGTSFWHFFNSWSEISRGSDKIQKLPVFERSFLPNFAENRLIPVPALDRKVLDKVPLPPLLEGVFHFGKDNVLKLKRRANSEAGTEKISSLQAVLAHLWRAVMRCRDVNPATEVGCALVIGARMRLPLPDTYFGNALHLTVVTLKNGDLQSKGLGWVALELNKNVGMQTKEEVKRIVEDLVNNLKIFKKDGVLVQNGFLIGSSPRHNVFASDFGWGKPVAVRSGGAQKYDGKITLFPAADPGGIDVEACLAPETLIAVGNDSEFMEGVTL